MFTGPSKGRNSKCASRLWTSPSFPASFVHIPRSLAHGVPGFLLPMFVFPGLQRNLKVPQRCGQTESSFRQENGVWCHILSLTPLNSCGAWCSLYTGGMESGGQAGTDLPAAKLPLKSGSNSVQVLQSRL